jgi:4-amino-4-deoxy-L-arabinose transferase-like glycosyltransferase
MERKATLGLLLLTVAAFVLRLAYLLNSHPFIDEFTTALAARAILQRGLPVLPSGLFYEHGLLFSYLDAPFVGLADEEMLFVFARLPSLLIGTATVPLLYWVGRRWLSDRAGLVAAALLAFSPEGMVWGGRARMYALAQLLVLLLVFLAYEGSWGEGRPRLRWLALLTLLATLLTQFGAMILVLPLVAGGLIVGWLTHSDGARPWFLRRAALVEGAALAVVIGLGVLVKRLGQPLGASPLGGEGTADLVAEVTGAITYQVGLAFDGSSAIKFLARQFGVPHHLWLTFVAVIGGLLGLWVWISARKLGGQQVGEATRQRGNEAAKLQSPISLLYLWFVFGLTVVEMITLLQPWRRNPRYLVMVLPLFYLIVAAGLEQIPNLKSANQQISKSANLKSPVSISLVVFAVVQTVLLVPDLRVAYRTPEPAYEEAFQYVADQWQPGDVLLTMNTSGAALYLGHVDYFAVQEDAAQFLLNADTRPVDRWLGVPWLGTAADLNRVLNEHPRAWFVADTIRLPVYYRGNWLALLKTQMELVWSGDEALVYRTQADRLPIPATPQVTLDAQFGDVVRLDGYSIVQSSNQPINQPSGQSSNPTLHLTLFWTALAQMDTDYTVFLHVQDATRARVTQRDSQPLDGDYPTSQWRTGETVVDPYRIKLPADLPPGEYQIWGGLYQLETLERLPVVGDTSGENAVQLGVVAIP